MSDTYALVREIGALKRERDELRVSRDTWEKCAQDEAVRIAEAEMKRDAMQAVVDAAREVLRHPMTMRIKLREALAALDKEPTDG